MLLAVDFSCNNFWTTDLQFVAFTTHVFDQHSQLQFASAGNFHYVGRLGISDLD